MYLSPAFKVGFKLLSPNQFIVAVDGSMKTVSGIQIVQYTEEYYKQFFFVVYLSFLVHRIKIEYGIFLNKPLSAANGSTPIDFA